MSLAAGDAGREPLTTGRLTLSIGDKPVALELSVPAGPTATEDVLPIFQGLSNLVTTLGVERAEVEGRTVSCRAGCGACCRQLVPIAEPEARDLARVVAAMPEPRRSHVRARFASALAALEPAGLLERAMNAQAGEGREIGLAWFAQNVACP